MNIQEAKELWNTRDSFSSLSAAILAGDRGYTIKYHVGKSNARDQAVRFYREAGYFVESCDWHETDSGNVTPTPTITISGWAE